MLEDDVKKEMREYLKKAGWFVFHVHQKGYRVYKGISDYIIVKGKTIFLEVKKPGGVQSKEQKTFQSDVESHGGIYICSESLTDLISKLEAIK